MKKYHKELANGDREGRDGGRYWRIRMPKMAITNLFDQLHIDHI